MASATACGAAAGGAGPMHCAPAPIDWMTNAPNPSQCCKAADQACGVLCESMSDSKQVRSVWALTPPHTALPRP